MKGILGVLTQIGLAALVTWFIVIKVLGLFPPLSLAAVIGY